MEDKKEDLFVHYWQLPEELFISLKSEFHERFCKAIQNKLNNPHKNCFYEILDCPKWHAQRLFTQFTRLTINELEILRSFSEIGKEEVEKNFDTIGCHEDGTIIRNPKLPFSLKDLVYVASHLMFDGTYRDKKGCYFYAYEPSLVEYHKKRLGIFGEVPINLVEGENQLYFSYALGFIASKILEIPTFKSTKTDLSEKLKKLAREYKVIIDEIIKALIIDEGKVENQIIVELANENLVLSLYDVINPIYKMASIKSRTRRIAFKGNLKWKYVVSSWTLRFTSDGFDNLYRSISPLPIRYKQDNLKFLYKCKVREYNQRASLDTKKIIVGSLLDGPKTLNELAKASFVTQRTISGHILGHPTYASSLVKQGIVHKIGTRRMKKGGFTEANIYGIKNYEKAREFLNNK